MLFKIIPFIYFLITSVCADQAIHIASPLIQNLLLPVLEDPTRPEIAMGVLWREEVLPLKGNRQIQVQIVSPKKSASYPVIIFSGGWSVNFRHYSQILQALAAKGYVIVNIDHYYQKDTAPHSQEFDELVKNLKCELKGQDDQTKEKRFTRTKFRALDVYYQDTVFILQHLREILQLVPADLSKIVLMGHSLGGNAGKKVVENLDHLAIAVEIKTAIKACVSLDSRYNQLNLKTTFEKPTLVLGAGEEYKKLDPLRHLPPQPTLHLVILEKASHVAWMDYVIYPILGKGTNSLMAGLNASAMQDTDKLLDKVKAEPKAFFNGSSDQLVEFINDTVERIDQFLKEL